MIIEDVTDRYESETQAQRDAGDAVASQHDDEDSFHDAAESEDSFEDATEHFDVDALRAAQRRAQAAAEAGGARGSAGEQAVQDQPVADADTVVSTSGQQAPGGAEGQHDTAPAAAAESPAADDAADGAAEQQEGAVENQGECADDDWPQGRRFREPHAAQPEEGEEPAEAEAEAGLPPEEVLPPEEIQKRTEEAESLKQQGNALYAEGKLEEAQAKYGEALDAAPLSAPQRAVYFANRAAAALKLQQWSNAAADCTAAIGIDAVYLKAYMRRATAYEQSDDLERALTDLKKVVELDPGNAAAVAKAAKLEPVVLERREKMKEEMIGKLKDLGNTVLGKFGMSLDNFKAVKDPTTGAYSINFGQ